MEAIPNHTDFPVLSPRLAKPPQGPGHLLVSVQLASERESSVAPKAATSWALEVPSTCSRAQHTTVIQPSSALFSFRGNRANICFQLLAKLAVQARTLLGEQSTQDSTLGSRDWRQGPAFQKESVSCSVVSNSLIPLGL